MNQNKKGFTLVELLAIIVVLAAISLIIGPMIIKTIDDSKKRAFVISADGIMEAIRMNSANNEYIADSFIITNGMIKNSSGTIVKKTGGEMENGAASIDEDGNIVLSIENGTWCATKEADKKDIVIDKYDKQKCQYFPSDNLVTNGSGEYGYNLNFSQLTFVKEGDKGYFTRTSRSVGDIQNDAFIPIDPNSTYTLSADLKSSNTEATYYMGIAEYDIDKKLVLADNVMYINNTLTTLTRELKNGDTEVYVSDLTNFLNASTTPIQRLGLIFWDYQDSTGYTYPELTYSRNVWRDLYTYDNIDKQNKKLKLKTAWTKGTIPVGTKLSQSSGHSGYNYLLKYGTTALPSWVTYTGMISGVNTGPNVQYTKFREGTKYIKFLSLENYNNTPSTTSSYRNISIKKQ